MSKIKKLLDLVNEIKLSSTHLESELNNFFKENKLNAKVNWSSKKITIDLPISYEMLFKNVRLLSKFNELVKSFGYDYNRTGKDDKTIEIKL